MKFNYLPVTPLRITSHYGKRDKPMDGASTDHKGVDLGRDRTKPNTKVILVRIGKLTFNGWNDYRGWFAIFDIGQGYSVLYQHLKTKCELKVGKTYPAGTTVGIMANSTNPDKLVVVTHLHFEVRLNGKPINPEPFLYDLEEEEMVTKQKVLVNGVERTINRILKDGENYIRLRDIEDVLKIADVEYDPIKKMPKVVD